MVLCISEILSMRQFKSIKKNDEELGKAICGTF